MVGGRILDNNGQIIEAGSGIWSMAFTVARIGENGERSRLLRTGMEAAVGKRGIDPVGRHQSSLPGGYVEGAAGAGHTGVSRRLDRCARIQDGPAGGLFAVRRRGFEYAEEQPVSEEEKATVSKSLWGLQDGRFYSRFFSRTSRFSLLNRKCWNHEPTATWPAFSGTRHDPGAPRDGYLWRTHGSGHRNRPGTRRITRHLLPRTDELHVVELDRSLVTYLERKFATETKLKIHQGNVLETDLSGVGPGTVLAGNLPYYITSPIIEKFVRMNSRFPVAVFLNSGRWLNVSWRPPGSRSYGYLTVATRLVCNVELVSKVPPSAFVPPPKVDSGAILLRRKDRVPEQLNQLLRFVGKCFPAQAKTLRNNLRGIYGEQADSMPEARLRAEQLSIEQFVDLFQR